MSFTHPSLAGFSSTGLIHIPVSFPLPASGGQLEAVERLRIHPRHITPRPAVCGQQDVSEAVHRVPPLTQTQTFMLCWQHSPVHCDERGAWTHLVFIGLLPVADGGLAGYYVQVNMVVTADAPAAPLACSDALQLQQHVVSAHPAQTGRGQAVHPAVYVHGPQLRDGHDAP